LRTLPLPNQHEVPWRDQNEAPAWAPQKAAATVAIGEAAKGPSGLETCAEIADKRIAAVAAKASVLRMHLSFEIHCYRF
jgi:hypothetical protein